MIKGTNKPNVYCRSIGAFYWQPKWPNTTFFGNFQKKNTVSEINGKIPLSLELEFQKFEFLISYATVALLSWNLSDLKKLCGTQAW